MRNQELDERRDEALRRYRIIAPLLDEGASEWERKNARWLILSQEGISARTLRRYLAAFKEGGFDALLPKERKDKGSCKAIAPEALALATELRKELPERSAERIQQLLEKQGHTVARSTLDRHLRQQGLSGKEIKQKQAQSVSRRFNRIGRNTLWQADLKYGPYLPDRKNSGRKIRTYLVAIIDDATRMVVHAEFYDHQKLPVLEDSFRKAVTKCGVPDALYVDNGKIFVSQWMKLACAKLRIRHLTAKAYSPESKGKIERFNRTVEEFLREAALEKPQTLEALNSLFRAWLSEGYNHRSHSSLAGKSPAQAFTQDSKSLRFPSPEALRDAFLWEKSPKVDKSGCISLEGIEYELGVQWYRKKILIKYDPFDLSQVELWYEGEKCKVAQPVNVGEYNGQIKKPQEQLEKASQSKLLRMFAEESKKRMKQQLGAFRLGEEVDSHV
jgi:transposase InsO family protein